jgi:hypothetical protein
MELFKLIIVKFLNNYTYYKVGFVRRDIGSLT